MIAAVGRLAALMVCLLAVGGCSWSLDAPGPRGDAGPNPAVLMPMDDEAVEEARRDLARLVLRDRADRGPTYQRERFGGAWRDLDGNGCNQRDDVLRRDADPGSLTTAQDGNCDHDVLAGTWQDPYTGGTLTFTDLKDPRQAQAIQIDHVVPLAEAWASGAANWSDRRRERYANDLDALLAVDGPTNASKSDDDPAAWRPRKAFQCTYAVRWIGTKARWKLAADAPEVRALEEMLGSC